MLPVKMVGEFAVVVLHEQSLILTLLQWQLLNINIDYIRFCCLCDVFQCFCCVIVFYLLCMLITNNVITDY